MLRVYHRLQYITILKCQYYQKHRSLLNILVVRPTTAAAFMHAHVDASLDAPFVYSIKCKLHRVELLTKFRGH